MNPTAPRLEGPASLRRRTAGGRDEGSSDRALRPSTGETPLPRASESLPEIRVAYIAPAYPVRSETFVRREVEALRAAGDHAVVLSLRPPPEGEPGGPVIYSRRWLGDVASESILHPLRALRTLATSLSDALGPSEPLSLRSRLKLPVQALAGLRAARLARAAGVDRLHAHFAHAPATIAMYAALQLGVPFSFTGHANDLFQRRSLLRRKLARADFVACISDWHARLYRSIEPAARCVRVRCGVPPLEAAPTPGDGTLRLLTVARLVPKKGIDTLVSAVAALSRRRRVRLVVAGDGPQRPDLERAAAGLPVAFLGPVDNASVPGLLADCDAFALPCRPDAAGDMDGIPVVLMEAMSAGVPVVAGDLPAIRELVEPDVTGLLVPGGDVVALADALSRLADDPSLRARITEAGRARARSEFSLDVNVARLRHAFCGRAEHAVLGGLPTP